MSEVVVMRERESGTGWEMVVRVGAGSGTGPGSSLHTVKLSWADHEHLTRGAATPSETAAAVVRVALEEARGGSMPEGLDVGRLSRRVERFAERVRQRLGGQP